MLCSTVIEGHRFTLNVWLLRQLTHVGIADTFRSRPDAKTPPPLAASLYLAKLLMSRNWGWEIRACALPFLQPWPRCSRTPPPRAKSSCCACCWVLTSAYLAPCHLWSAINHDPTFPTSVDEWRHDTAHHDKLRASGLFVLRLVGNCWQSFSPRQASS